MQTKLATMIISCIFIKASVALGIFSPTVNAAGNGISVTVASGIKAATTTEPGFVYAASEVLDNDIIPPHNCDDILRRDIVPQVDCSYSWENCGFDNHMEYQIRISPMGETSPQWCEMLYKAVMNNIHYNTRWESCNRDYKTDINGKGIWLDVTMPKPIEWKEEWRHDVENAIRDTMCPGQRELTYWVNEGCYRSSICRQRYWKRGLELEDNLTEAASSEDNVEPETAPDTTLTIVVATSKPTIAFFAAHLEAEATATSPGLAPDTPRVINTIEFNMKAGQECSPTPGVPDFTCANVDSSKISSVAAHCSYVWNHGKNHNLLDYKIAINPTGQDSTCWCKQILSAVRARCPLGDVERAYPIYKCDTKHIRNALGWGMFINFYANVWVAGEDNRSCIKEAIESTTCGIPINFEKGGCFKRE